MSFLLLSVDHIIAIYDEVLEPNELQGMVAISHSKARRRE